MSLTKLDILLHDTAHDLSIIDSYCHIILNDNFPPSVLNSYVEKIQQAKCDLQKKLDKFYNENKSKFNI